MQGGRLQRDNIYVHKGLKSEKHYIEDIKGETVEESESGLNQCSPTDQADKRIYV